jgi:apolipoprotein N-acyltransferase
VSLFVEADNQSMLQKTQSAVEALPGWSWMRGRILVVGFVLGTAVLLAAGWINELMFPLTLIGMSLICGFTIKCTPGSAFCVGWAAGFFASLLAANWAPQAIAYTVNISILPSLLIFLALAAFESLRFGLFAWIGARFLCSFPRWLIALPGIWVGVEFVIPSIFSWRIGGTATGFLPAIQLAEISGMSGVSLLFMSAAVLPLFWFAQRSEKNQQQLPTGCSESTKPKSRRPLGPQPLILATFVLLALAFGVYRVYFCDWSDGVTFRVAALQVNPSFQGSEEKLQDLSRNLDAQVDLICWPEASLGIYDERLTHFRDEYQIALWSRDPNRGRRPLKQPPAMLLGTGKTFPADAGPRGPYHVSALLVDQQENIVQRYDKQQLMPLGEYVPGQIQFPFLRRWAHIDTEMIPGTGPALMRLNEQTKLGLTICYEDLDPAISRENVRAGANLLVALVNGSSFANPLALEQHQRIALTHAVEHRRYLVRSSATGVTCFVDPVGGTYLRAPCNSDEILIGDVRLRDQLTLYTRYGDFLGWGCALFTLLTMLLPSVTSHGCHTEAAIR